MSKVININKCFELFEDTFSPKIVGILNGQLVMVVRCEGDKVPWHIHENEDEMFFVIDGILEVQEKDSSTILNSGEFYIVKRGIEHRVVPQGHVKLLLFEPSSIKHTGSIKSEVTQKQFEHLKI
jgi:mannose-6-phosphate isomerase-like protein (cupin superfamily)